jgi:hypothetical protein
MPRLVEHPACHRPLILEFLLDLFLDVEWRWRALGDGALPEADATLRALRLLLRCSFFPRRSLKVGGSGRDCGSC